MTLTTALYLAGSLGKFNDFLDVISKVTMVLIIIYTIILGSYFFIVVDDNEERKKFFITFFGKKYYYSILSLLILMLLYVFTPSDKMIYMMIGATAAQDVYQSDLGVKVMKIIDVKLDEMLSEKDGK